MTNMATITCEFCGEEVDTTDRNVFKRVVGWVQNKGGASPVVLQDGPFGWAHYACIDIAKSSPIDASSSSLF